MKFNLTYSLISFRLLIYTTVLILFSVMLNRIIINYDGCYSFYEKTRHFKTIWPCNAFDHFYFVYKKYLCMKINYTFFFTKMHVQIFILLVTFIHRCSISSIQTREKYNASLKCHLNVVLHHIIKTNRLNAL